MASANEDEMLMTLDAYGRLDGSRCSTDGRRRSTIGVRIALRLAKPMRNGRDGKELRAVCDTWS
jgi:hypothetical protein